MLAERENRQLRHFCYSGPARQTLMGKGSGGKREGAKTGNVEMKGDGNRKVKEEKVQGTGVRRGRGKRCNRKLCRNEQK
jgi:hypothetical protein